MVSLSLLQGVFPTQGSNPGLPHCRLILYQLSHKRRPKYWSGEPIPSPADIPYAGIEPGSPALQVDSLPTELSEKPPLAGRHVGIESPCLTGGMPHIGSETFMRSDL